MIFRQIIPTVLALFASLSVSAQTDTAATDSLTSTGDESKLVMPNTFTPNGDGHNELAFDACIGSRVDGSRIGLCADRKRCKQG